MVIRCYSSECFERLERDVKRLERENERLRKENVILEHQRKQWQRDTGHRCKHQFPVGNCSVCGDFK